jgi:hypothetical protein
MPLLPARDNLLVRFSPSSTGERGAGLESLIARIGGDDSGPIEITPAIAAAMLDRRQLRRSSFKHGFYVDQRTCSLRSAQLPSRPPRKAQGQQAPTSQQWSRSSATTT